MDIVTEGSYGHRSPFIHCALKSPVGLTVRARVESWVLSLPLEVELHATSQPSKNCAFDGSVDEQDEDCVILHVVGGSDTFRMTVNGQVFHSPDHKDCIQKWAHARAQINPEDHSLYVQLIAGADAIRSVGDGYESARR